MTSRDSELGTPSIYFDARLNTEVAKIFPGQYFVTDRDIVLVTVLGSCVAACIRIGVNEKELAAEVGEGGKESIGLGVGVLKDGDRMPSG